ncbi:MAG: hypothetical protein INR66_21310 [Gordonia polyisoprenivorans]|nr:hypothetical protein [Gordonia polyisoprenivorans]
MSRATSIFAPTPAVAHRRRRVGVVVLATVVLVGGYWLIYGILAAAIALGWCA